MNWIALEGKSEIKDSTITFFPSEGSDEKRLNRLASNRLFENGTIQFSINFHEETKSTFSIVFGTDSSKTMMGFNSRYTNRPFSIRQKILNSSGLEILSQAGSSESLKPNTDYQVKLEVNGSNIHFYINEVLVCEAIGSSALGQIELVYRGEEKLTIKNFTVQSERPKAFVVMQFSDDFNDLYQEVIKPVCETYGYECKRGDEYFTNGSILQDIIQSIKESSVIIADITPNNPNVFYELGYAHAINKPTILLSDKKREKLPFDISGFRTLFYDNTIAGKSAVEAKLKEHLQNIK